MELEEIVNAGVALGNNEYANLSEYTFHSKLYEITGGSYKYRTGEKGKDCNSHRFIELYQE